MNIPKPLRQGACVGLIGPGSPITQEQRLRCRQKLEEMGFSVVFGEHLQKDENLYGYLAGSAMDRASDLNNMFADSRIEAVFCTRGGYGSTQLLPYLDYECIRENPKVFVGYSDITALHTVFQRYCQMVTYHGPMVKSDFLWEGKNGSAEAYVWKSLWAACGMRDTLRFQNPAGEKLTVIREGCARGKLLGGNLSVLARSLGTVYGPAREECILFLEDVGESLPRIHMYLTQMKYAGIFDGAKGVLLGDFTGCDNRDYDESLTTEAFLRDWFSESRVPVIGNVCSDHRIPMGTLPLGAHCRMEAEGDTAEIRFFI